MFLIGHFEPILPSLSYSFVPVETSKLIPSGLLGVYNGNYILPFNPPPRKGHLGVFTSPDLPVGQFTV